MSNKLIKIDKPDLIRFSNNLVKRSSSLLNKLQNDSVINYKTRILTAVNDENFIRFFKEEMNSAGFSIQLCNSFEKMINIFSSEIFDLSIITNLGLLPKYIPEVIENLKLINSKIPILVISAYGKLRYNDEYIDDDEANFIDKITKLGAESFYPVPFDFDDLICKINEIIYFNIYSYSKNYTNNNT